MSSLEYLLCLLITLNHSRAIYTVAQNQRVICDGDDFEPKDHKYLVKLEIVVDVDVDYIFGYPYQRTDYCSGSIIDKKWIISAAHCFPDNVTKITILGSKERILGFSKTVIIHPNYIQDPNFNYYNGQNDLALVRTPRSIRWNAFTQPIGLARLSAFGSSGIIAGYETYSSMQLPLEDVVVVNQCECAPRDSTMLCSQSLTHMIRVESGGALTTDDGLIGVVSAIASLPTGEQYVIVDISLHFDWIQKKTGKKLLDVVEK